MYLPACIPTYTYVQTYLPTSRHIPNCVYLSVCLHVPTVHNVCTNQLTFL